VLLLGYTGCADFICIIIFPLSHLTSIIFLLAIPVIAQGIRVLTGPPG
jgi:hypothetical protein